MGKANDSAVSLMRVVLFGATGNLGVHVLPRLLNEGHDVTVFVRSEARLRAAFGSSDMLSRVRIVEGDAMCSAAVDVMLSSGFFDTLVSTAGCVDNSALSDFESTRYCKIFCNSMQTATTQRGMRR